MKAVILHNHVDDSSSLDEKDTLEQLKSISESLVSLGYSVVPVSFLLNIEDTVEHIRSANPDLVFNLVESVQGSGRLISFGPAILDYIRLPYTGNSTDAIFLSSNKIFSKKLMRLSGIPTPDWITTDGSGDPAFTKGALYIIKAVWEHASIGMDDNSVVEPDDLGHLKKMIYDRNRHTGTPHFAEMYIDGREFNLSVMSSDKGAVVHPPAEMTFVDYPDEKVKIIGYSAKWHEESFEYINTVRTFDFLDADKKLLDSMKKISLSCWDVFELNGYARVDFRVDSSGRPYVLEINANPCITIYSGYTAACEKAGMDYISMIKRIIEYPVRPV